MVDRQILTQLIQIEMDDSKRLTVVAEDILPPEGKIEEATSKPAKPPQAPMPLEAKTAPAPAAAQETDEAPAKKRRRRRKRSRRSKRKVEKEREDTPKE